MGFAPTTSKDKDTGKNIFNFSLRLPELIGLAVIILVGFIWVFIFGLLVGRGYQPEEALPELKHIMPSQQQVVEITPTPVEENIGSNSSVQPNNTPASRPIEVAEAQPVTKKPEEVVLKPEQLNFFEQLKAKEASNSPATAPKVKKAHVVAKQAKPAPKVQPKQSVAAARKPKAQKQQAALKKDSPAFEYIYQVAASTNKEAATKLRSSMEGKGFTTSMATAVVKNATWYRVNVHFVGSPNQLTQFKSRLAGAGYSNPLLKKKKQR
ncbi:SPOR domain-containing protein [Halodesulfovibrio sp.]|jgi:cell division protein FtsN|uniref:SPOR domain-containing protein n=1 Tax=Halodesulfovibrio sp. TaxID=1912772 RepID=UPI0025F35352|nr:SPOR domain-containing protein [Halodesulfovibrio sp.]MCT4626882.1 SPOR domain-containing protein [Halodesulfovibrio sp.]